MLPQKLPANDISDRKEIDTLCWLIEDAFDGNTSNSFMNNLTNVREQDWTALPSGGERSISDILEHVGWCKWMYEDYAFGYCQYAW